MAGGFHPLLLLLVPVGIILCGAATGIAQALRIGLRAHLLRIMGIEEMANGQTTAPRLVFRRRDES